jgi:protein TonB
VAAGIAVIIYSFFHVEEIAPPSASLTFFSAPPPPPPPPPPPKKKSSSTVEKKPEIKPTQVTQPTDVKQIVQPKKEEPKEEEDDGVEGGEEGGVKGGQVGGVKGGVVGGVVGGTVGGTGTDLGKGPPPKTVASFTLIKDQLQHPDPRMPEMFRQKFAGQKLQGMYKVCLRQDGHVSDVSVMTSLPGADSDVINQIKAGWVYRPQPVPVCFVSVIKVEIK